MSGGVRSSQNRHHAEKPLPKQKEPYQNPFDGEIDFYENQYVKDEEDKISKKVEKALIDEDNVEEIFGINKRGLNRDIKRADEEMDIEPVIGGQPP